MTEIIDEKTGGGVVPTGRRDDVPAPAEDSGKADDEDDDDEKGEEGEGDDDCAGEDGKKRWSVRVVVVE